MAKKTMKNIAKIPLKNANATKCSKTFCKKVLIKTRDKVIKETKRTRKIFVDKQKELKTKIAVAEKKGNKAELDNLTTEHVFNQSIIDEFDKMLKPNNNVFNQLITSSCSKFYCNPGCKNTAIGNTFSGDYYDNLPPDFVADLKKNGATSGCVVMKPLDDFF